MPPWLIFAWLDDILDALGGHTNTAFCAKNAEPNLRDLVRS